jgi:hypothetical protein
VKLTIVVPDEPATLNAALEGLVRINEAMMLAAIKSGRPVPPLYTSGIRYGEEPHGREWWQTVADNLAELERVQRSKAKKSTTDCEDLAGHRAAELRVWGPAWPSSVVAGHMAGVPYPARAICVRTGPNMYHAIVEHPDGTREDPSRALGMGSHRRPSPLRRKSAVNQDPGIFFNTFRGPRGVWRADLKLNTDETGNGYTIRGAHMGGWFDAVKHLVTKAAHFVQSPEGAVALTAAFGPIGPIAANGALLALHQVAHAANQAPAPGEQLAKVAPKFTDASLRQLAKGIARIAQGRATSMSGGPCCLGDIRELRARLESQGANPGVPAAMDPWPLAAVNSSDPHKMMRAMLEGNPFASLAGMSSTEREHADASKKLAEEARRELVKKQHALNLEYQRRIARAQRG